MLLSAGWYKPLIRLGPERGSLHVEARTGPFVLGQWWTATKCARPFIGHPPREFLSYIELGRAASCARSYCCPSPLLSRRLVPPRVRLDPEPDWAEIAALVRRSYRLIAPKWLSARISGMGAAAARKLAQDTSRSSP